MDTHRRGASLRGRLAAFRAQGLAAAWILAAAAASSRRTARGRLLRRATAERWSEIAALWRHLGDPAAVEAVRARRRAERDARRVAALEAARALTARADSSRPRERPPAA